MASFSDRRNLFPGKQNAPLQRESADLLAVVGIQLGDHIRTVIFERANFRQIARVDK